MPDIGNKVTSSSRSGGDRIVMSAARRRSGSGHNPGGSEMESLIRLLVELLPVILPLIITIDIYVLLSYGIPVTGLGWQD